MNKRPNPRDEANSRENIARNEQDVQVEKVADAGPNLESQDVRPVEKDLIQTKQKEANIGRVDTPEQRVGDNKKSQNLPFDDNTPLTGQKPFVSEELTPLEPEPQVPIVNTSVGFEYKRGNYFVNPMDSLPEAEVFSLSRTVEEVPDNTVEKVVGSRPRSFQDFFN